MRIESELERAKQLGCYAVKVQSRSEENVSEALRYKGFDAFSPSYVQERHYSDRIKRVRCALIPGYVFVRMCSEEVLPIVATAGVSYIVRSGKSLHPLPPEEADAIGRLCRIESKCAPCTNLTVGQRVRIESGPLKGIEGVLARTGVNRQIVITINSIFRSIRVDTQDTLVKALEPESDSGSVEVIQTHSTQVGLHAGITVSRTGSNGFLV